MRSRFLAAAIAVVSLTTPAFAGAAALCPPEVKQAKDLLTAKTASAKTKTTGPSKVLVAARGQDEQAARSQKPQAARGQDEQAARGQDEQAPRNVAKARANALANARRLVNEAETACKDADTQRALANAHAAMELLKYIP
jgi:hypothetical protein